MCIYIIPCSLAVDSNIYSNIIESLKKLIVILVHMQTEYYVIVNIPQACRDVWSIMHECCNRIQHEGKAQMLYVVTALMHSIHPCMLGVY